MRLSLLDQQQQQQRSGNQASASNSTPNFPPPVLNERPPTPQASGTHEPMPRRMPSGTIVGALANSGTAITVSVGSPSSFPAAQPHPSLPVAPTHVSRDLTPSSSSSSAFASLRGRLTFGKSHDASRSDEGGGGATGSGTGRHRRAESNPPPATTVNGAHGTATAFLQAPNTSDQQARSAPVSPRVPYVGLPLENRGVPSTVLEIPTESAKTQVSAPVTEAGETPASTSAVPAATVPPPAPIPVSEPVEYPPATSN
jgi:hypothetical protein